MTILDRISSSCQWVGVPAIIFFAVMPAIGQDVDMRTASPVTATPVDGQVLGGQKAAASHWPATFVFRTPSGGGCTSTLVGSRVVLTAAHCIADGGSAFLHAPGTVVGMTCNHHPAYATDISADFALCLLDAPFSKPSLGYEYINVGPLPSLDSTLWLLGYGCTTNQGELDFGNLYQGITKVKDLSFNSFVLTEGGAAVCYGDSGGAAYRVSNDAMISRQRQIVGIASRGDIETVSLLSATGLAVFSDWARQWGQSKAVNICGVLGPTADCHEH